MPIESTQRTRFFLARMRMMCVLLVGSALQSLAKQTMDWPSSMQHLRNGERLLAIEELPLPDLEIEQEPQALAVIGAARAVLVGQGPYDGGLEESSGQRARREHELVERRLSTLAQPAAQRDGEAHLAPPQDRRRHD